MHILDTFHRLSLRLLEGLVIALMAVLVLDVSWQVITRYLLGSPSAWTDELATILMIWVAALGASLGFIQKAHLGIDVIVRRLSPRQANAARIGSQVMIGCFAVAILLYGGTQLVRITLATDQTSPALGLKMGAVYFALPLSGVFILLSVFDEIWQPGRPQKIPAAKAAPNPDVS